MITLLGLEVALLYTWVQDYYGNVDHIVIEPLVVVVELLLAGIDVRAKVPLRGDTGGLLGRSVFCFMWALVAVRTSVLRSLANGLKDLMPFALLDVHMSRLFVLRAQKFDFERVYVVAEEDRLGNEVEDVT
ncbi:hypothetical protein Q7P35_008212 [Cladosporium inversicolor]